MCVFSVTVSLLLAGWCGRTMGELENNIIRLHVIANSDSSFDQSLKLEVRDRLTDLARAKGATPGIAELEQTANEVLISRNVPYRAMVTYGGYYVNRRNYESFILPEGRYTAACVKLGRAEGKNWWCVLSPPLCFTKSALGHTDKLSECLDGETTTAIKGITVKLKVLELASRFVNKNQVHQK